MLVTPFSFSVLMPPMIFLISAILGIVASWGWRRAGTGVALASLLLLYACSTPLVSSALLALAAAQPMPQPAELPEPQAIVLVTADARWETPPSNRGEPGPLSLARMIETARLYRSHPLPVLVTGGIDPRSGRSLAGMIGAALERDFQVPVRWREERSTNTFENAAFSAPILLHEGISKAFVVAQDWDMPRVVWSFDRGGITAVPAAAGLPSTGITDLKPDDFMPNYRGFSDTFYALHELLGLQYYRLRYGSRPR